MNAARVVKLPNRDECRPRERVRERGCIICVALTEKFWSYLFTETLEDGTGSGEDVFWKWNGDDDEVRMFLLFVLAAEAK